MQTRVDWRYSLRWLLCGLLLSTVTVIAGEAQEDVLREAAEDLINEAMGEG